MNDVARMTPQLDWCTLPLSGRVLIEASAGTGKTWNIGLIFLRLLLEQGLPVEKILVLTFTEAAAQELRERLRARLAEAETYLCDFAGPEHAEAQAQVFVAAAPGSTRAEPNELATWLAQKYSESGAAAALRRIRLARIDIDRAPIATIHAVCQRILREFPLQAGSALAIDKLFDETELLRECIEDFWRRRYLVDEADAAEDDVLAKGPEGLLFDLRDLLMRDAVMLPLDAAAPMRARVLYAAYEFCRTEISRRARQRGGQTYAMLIDSVYERVDAAPAFARELFEAFPAALIDEFQDTDHRQFAIFDRIYRDENGEPRGLMAMIGDPKQAIYAFRGGDLAAYLHAREQATARFALATNQRSSTNLVAACNALYANSDGGFDDELVRYRPVTAAGRADLEPYTDRGAPLLIHAFRGDARNSKGDQPLENIGELEELALEDCAACIVELLNDDSRTIGGKRVVPGDVAVLLPQNRHVADLRKRLIARGVPCVGSGRGSVFDTAIARDLELFLYAVLHADDERAVRGALATRLLGKTCADILAWQNDSTSFERQLERFANWHAMAQTRGLLGVLRDLLMERGAALLALSEGERLLTDLRHLGEALAEQECVSGPDAAYAWFAAIRREGHSVEVDAAEARQLRIESDAQRVQLMTLHAAKGLEFPIVFLPLLWRITHRDGAQKPKILHFHDAAGNACVDIGSTQFEKNRALHDREDLQERLRLLYVGLTRAIHALHVYWVDRKQAAAASELWQIPAIDRLIRSAQRGLGLDVGEGSLPMLAQRLGGMDVVGPYVGGKIDYRGAEAQDKPRMTRAPLPKQRPFLWLHSFSSVVRRAIAADIEPAAADEREGELREESAEQAADSRLLALEVWRGRHFGDAVHKMLEGSLTVPIDRVALAARFARMATRPRNQNDGDAFAPVAEMLARTCESDLGDGLRLAALPASACVAEFEFQFPIDVRLRDVREICARHGCGEVVPAHLSASALEGMLTGFADLIFAFNGRYHVLDYKTNRLGTSLADYRGDALGVAMGEHHYALQALLYTVALHRYLRARLKDYAPDRHLGESWYLFVRAAGLAPDAGVWRRRWPIALIEALDAAFAGEQVTA